MKVWLLALCLNGHAGHPTEDGQVARLRRLFAQGSLPTMEGLSLGRPFNCLERMAVSGDDGEVLWEGSYLFHRRGRNLINRGKVAIDTYVFLKEGLTGRHLDQGVKYRDTLRIAANGLLISEWASSRGERDLKAASLAWPGLRVISYSECLPQQAPK